MFELVLFQLFVIIIEIQLALFFHVKNEIVDLGYQTSHITSVSFQLTIDILFIFELNIAFFIEMDINFDRSFELVLVQFPYRVPFRTTLI